MSIAAPAPTITYAGLDVAKATLALHLAGQHHDLPNTPAGHARLVRLLKKQPGVHLVCEASGGYEQGPVRALWAAALPVCVAEAGRVRHYARACGCRAKSDPIDAAVIAEFGAAVRPRPTPPPGAVTTMRVVASARAAMSLNCASGTPRVRRRDAARSFSAAAFR